MCLYSQTHTGGDETVFTGDDETVFAAGNESYNYLLSLGGSPHHEYLFPKCGIL